MKGALDVCAFPDQAELAPALAAAVADRLRTAIDARGRAVLAVSGGSTPVPFFAALQREVLDWRRVTVTLADERWVDTDHPDSNAALVQRCLLQREAARAQFQPLKNGAATAAAGCNAVSSQVSALFPLDVAVLGMGSDGHTASWFPGASNLEQALDRDYAGICVALQPAGGGHERLSLSLAAVLSAAQLYLHISGSEKWAALERALLPGPVADLPVRALLRRSERPLQVCYAIQDSPARDSA